jgi:hypothetical protein
MSTESITSVAVASFCHFVRERPSSKFAGRELECLAGYIHAWVASGSGVRDCQADFQTYLVAVIGIIDHWHQKPTVLNYEPSEPVESEPPKISRRVDRIFVDDNAAVPAILDPHFFQGQVFATLHPHVDSWWKADLWY